MPALAAAAAKAPPKPGWPIQVLWPGATVVIIAGGPSLDLAQVRHIAEARLDGRCRVITVNDAGFLAWWADWLHACDFKWWNWHRNTATKFPGIRTTCSETVPDSWAHYVRVLPPNPETLRRDGFAEDPDAVAGGGNGGYQAMQLGAKAGGTRLILVAFDMKRDASGSPHWFGDHPDRVRSDYESSMLPNFPSLADALKARGIEVVNASRETALTCFPQAKLEDVL